MRRKSPLSRLFMFPVYFLVDVLLVSLNHHALCSRDPSSPFLFSPFTRCAPFFSFPFSAIVRYLDDPAAFDVDKFFPSAFSPHSLLSTNAVVGRSYTCSIISIHIRLFNLNLSVDALWKRIGKALVRWFFVNMVCSWSCLKTGKWVNCFTGI